jgi:hypothetical protein
MKLAILKNKGIIYGISAFILVLLLMPIGHALMVLIEVFMGERKMFAAGTLGFIGVIFLLLGFHQNRNYTWSTLFGFLASIMVWTGWIEFSFVWIAEKNAVLPAFKDGEMVTKPEYLVMLSSLGLLFTMIVFYLFIRSNCSFFIWFQKLFNLKQKIVTQPKFQKSKAVIVFIETIMIIWFFYVILLLLYDEQILGERHPMTYLFAYGSLIWSVYLFVKLIKIQTFDYAIRYAVPTVVIFWNFIEILGRWNVFEEIWIQPLEYWKEMILFFLTFLVLIFILFINPKFQRMNRKTIDLTH